MEEAFYLDDLSRLNDDIEKALRIRNENSQHSASVIIDLLDLLANRYELTLCPEDLARGISLGNEALQQPSHAESGRRNILAGLARLSGLKFDSSKALEDINTAIAYIEMALDAPSHHSKPDYSVYHDLAILLWEKYTATQEAGLLDQYIDICEAALNQVSLVDSELSDYLFMRAQGYEARFDLTGDLESLETAIKNLEVALEITSKDDPDRLERLQSLGTCLEHRFEKSGAATELDNIIRVYKEAEGLPSPHIFQRHSVLKALGQRLKERYWRDGQIVDLNSAIAVSEEALDICLDTRGSKANMGTLLLMRFHHSSNIADIDRCVELTEQARADVSLDDPEYARLCHSMALVYAERFHLKGDMLDLEKAIRENRRALQTASPDEPRKFHMRMQLAELLGSLFEHSTNRAGSASATEALQEAIGLVSEVLAEGPRDTEDWPIWLATNGDLLVQRYRANGAFGDIEAAVSLTNEAVSKALEKHLSTPHIFTSNAICLRTRFEVTGSLEDINLAVDMSNTAVAATQEEASHMPERLLVLSICLLNRSVVTGALADMDHAIEAIERAVQLTPTSSVHRANRLRNLSQSYSLRHHRIRSANDLNKAIQAITTAIDETPDYRPEMALLISSRAGLVYRRGLAGGTNSLDDFEEAVQLYEKTLKLLAKDNVTRSSILTGLGTALLGRFTLNGSLEDSNRSINVLRESLDDMAADDIGRIGILNKLGMSYAIRFARSQLRSRDDLQHALGYFLQCFRHQGADYTERIQGAMGAADILGYMLQPQEALGILNSAIDSLPLITQHSLPQLDQQILLKAVSGLASKAAAAALSSGASGAEALMLLERSRGIIASLFMSQRLEDLSMLDAEAASDFLSARENLSTLSGSQYSGPGDHSADWNVARCSYILRSKARAKAEEELQAVIQRIQNKPETQNFLKPPSQSEVLELLGEDTIVLVNADYLRCDALILNQSFGTKIVKLTKLDFRQVRTRLDALSALRPYLEPTLLEWLWDTIAEPVVNALGFSEQPSNGKYPRIFWIMAGSLHPFPIHSAGRHQGKAGDTVMDRVMSSYSSSLRSFVHSRSSKLDLTEGSYCNKALLISMGKSKCRPELPDLPLAVEEINKVDTLSLKLGLEPVNLKCPTHSKVLTHLDSCAFFHFAGHGISDPLDPSRNGLLLEDGLLTVADLQNRPQNRTHPAGRTAFLGYLSACLTGANDAFGLEDEGIHLIGAFQLGGFRHVIGALWQVFDATCPRVAGAVYERLAASSLSDRAVCAALHGAIRQERDTWLSRLPQKKEVQETQSRSSEVGVLPYREDLGWILENMHPRAAGRDGRLNLRKKDISKLLKAEWVSYVHYGA